MISSIRNKNFWIILGGDILLLCFAYYFAHYIRFDGAIPIEWKQLYFGTLYWVVPLKIASLFYFDLYKGMWRYTSIYDAIGVVKAAAASSFFIVVIFMFVIQFRNFSRGILLIDFMLTLLFMGGFRIAIRLAHGWSYGRKVSLFNKERRNLTKILIIGAGGAGERLIREIRENTFLSYYDVVGLVDDDFSKKSMAIHGVPVLGDMDALEDITGEQAVDELIIAMPSASAVQMRRAVSLCKATGIPFKTIPSMSELIKGDITISAVREVRYADLLGRKSVELNVKEIGGYLTGKKVMITGGAGSIGSELCRQIASFRPAKIIIVDQNESALYEFELDLSRSTDFTDVVAALGPVQSRDRMKMVFEEYKPDVVFHAAAYKHVPMMEIHPWEAIYNNIIGTKTILALCCDYSVERTVVVSTDKAVRPTNVMGATKRVSEMLAQAYAKEKKTRCVAVRFGNVVGSIGSVIPLFKRQIEKGGPVTVTHPDVTRYFMTIPEASMLILQAGAMGETNEIFILKMGTPVRIYEMASDLITLSGYKPGEDIEIEFTGLRPGEKIKEELITDHEGAMKTDHDEIMKIYSENVMALDDLQIHINELVRFAENGDAEGIRAELKKIVPEYEPWVSK